MKRIICPNFILLLICLNFISPCLAQYSIVFKEDLSAAKSITRKPAVDKCLLAIRSEVNLTFDSNTENLTQPQKTNGVYFLEVSYGPQAISVYYDNIPTYLNFGQLQAANSLPELKVGEIRYFIVDIKPELEYADITDNELKRGNFTTPFGPNVSDALLVVRIFPNDLELIISETNNLISKFEKNGSTYNVFLKMPENKKFTNYDLLVKTKGADDLKVTVPKLVPKAVRFYRIKKPLVEIADSKIETENPLSPIKEPEKGVGDVSAATVADYRKNIIGNWAGSLGDDKTYIEFSTFDEGKKTLAGKIYANGIYMNFKGVVRFKTENDYQASLIIIKDDLITYGASLDLRFNSGVLSGLWIDDMGAVQDFSAVRSTTIISDNTSEVRQKIATLNKLASGEWNSLTSNAYFDNLILDKANVKQFSTISFIKSGQSTIASKGKLLSKSGMVSMVVSNVQFPGISSSCSVTLEFNEQEASASIISDDGSVFENVKLRRPVVQTNNKTRHTNNIYYVVSDKAYFYQTPNFADRTSHYLVNGQIPEVQISDENNDFIFGAFTYRGLSSKGFLKKSDISKININYLFNTKWYGLFGKDNINVVLDTIYWDANNMLKISGYNIVKKNKRDVEGQIILINDNQIQINLYEPGTDEWDGIFKITFNYNNEGSGVWLANNGKLRTEFKMQKILNK